MATVPDTHTTLDWPTIRDQAGAFVATEYASLDRSGAPITWPVTPYLGLGGPKHRCFHRADLSAQGRAGSA
jgi:hypothetical protein